AKFSTSHNITRSSPCSASLMVATAAPRSGCLIWAGASPSAPAKHRGSATIIRRAKRRAPSRPPSSPRRCPRTSMRFRRSPAWPWSPTTRVMTARPRLAPVHVWATSSIRTPPVPRSMFRREWAPR
ncbi:hypothetical protein LTR94_034739, partial [Friedmanniomyces endolithicus]